MFDLCAPNEPLTKYRKEVQMLGNKSCYCLSGGQRSHENNDIFQNNSIIRKFKIKNTKIISGRNHLKKAVILIPLILGLIFHSFESTAFSQDYILTVAVLVDSSNAAGYNTSQTNPGEFQRYPERYLEHLQIPYEIFDVSSQSPPANLSARQLVIIGHQNVNLFSAWQTAIVNAVNSGTGLINLDWNANVGTKTYIQSIFGATGSHAGSPGTSITVPFEVTGGGSNPHFIAAMQNQFTGDETDGSGNFLYNFHLDANNNLQPATSTVLDNVSGTIIAQIGSDPFILTKSYGLGRAVHFGTLEYLKADRFGFFMGIDDLFWRSLVWAARKPFVLRGYPRLWSVQMDDQRVGWGFRVRDMYDSSLTGSIGPDGVGGPWKVTGFVFTDNIAPGSPERASVINDIQQGFLQVSPHSLGSVEFGNLYWNDGNGQLNDADWLANLNELLQWKEGLGGSDSIPFFSDLGLLTFGI